MSIQANNIQYSSGNIQTCSLVIDSKVFQIQYQDGSYNVSSSGEATGERNAGHGEVRVRKSRLPFV